MQLTAKEAQDQAAEAVARSDAQQAKAKEESSKLSLELAKAKQEVIRLVQELATSSQTISQLQEVREEQKRAAEESASSKTFPLRPDISIWTVMKGL